MSGKRTRLALPLIGLVCLFALSGCQFIGIGFNSPYATPSSSVAPTGSTPMAAPSGYSSQQRIFEDQFSGSSLDTSKWVTYLGANGIRWSDRGYLGAPYSGSNMPGANNVAMFGPSQVTVNNGLTLTAQRNTNQYAGTYPWISGVVTTEGKFSLPTSGWYVQVKAQMPDVTAGMWPAIWFMPDTSWSRALEFDGHEGGDTGTWWPVNQNGATGYFAPGGRQVTYWNAGTNLSAGYHVYGFKYDPSTATITSYFDGAQVARNTNVVQGTYEIMLELQVASTAIAAWHTVPSFSTGPAAMHIAEVQVYS